jgi:hypothetical protein
MKREKRAERAPMLIFNGGPASRTMRLTGPTLMVVWDSITRTDPLFRIVAAGLAERASPDQRAAGRAAVRQLKALQRDAWQRLHAELLEGSKTRRQS